MIGREYKPSGAHLYIYGARTYPLERNIPKFKLDLKASIGYLVGYDSTNIYRIWVPSKRRVVSTRDVTFNEELTYKTKEKDLSIMRHTLTNV